MKPVPVGNTGMHEQSFASSIRPSKVKIVPMRTITKILVLFWVAILVSLSVVTTNYSSIDNYKNQNSGFQNFAQHSFAETPFDFYFTSKNSTSVSPINNEPVPNLINCINNFSSFGFIPELRIMNIFSQYFSYSKIIHQSLSKGDIVFPFNYFW